MLLLSHEINHLSLEEHMKKLAILFLVVSLCILLGYQNSFARDNYKTYEVIEVYENGLTLRDRQGNVIDIDKASEGYKVGYKVRYDSTRNRLKKYRWQDYEVRDVTYKVITLKHQTGEEISVHGNFSGKFAIGDRVRYDAVDGKILPEKKRIQWEQYEVIEAAYNKLTLKKNSGEIVTLHAKEFTGFQGVYFGSYEVGDLVQYSAEKNKLKRGGRKTYQWDDYKVVAISDNSITLVKDQGEELVVQGKYDRRYKVGDRVKYDSINDIIKKRKKD
jgi:hypothetical protein